MVRIKGLKKPNIIGRFTGKIHEINRRYANPQIHMSRGVRIALIFLRLYLIFLVLILAYKFITTLGH